MIRLLDSFYSTCRILISCIMWLVSAHQRGGSLDVVCTQGLTCKSFVIEDVQLFDHYPIYFDICFLMAKKNLPPRLLLTLG